MPVNEEDVVNIMGGMPEGIRLNDHRRRLKTGKKRLNYSAIKLSSRYTGQFWVSYLLLLVHRPDISSHKTFFSFSGKNSYILLDRFIYTLLQY